MEYVKEFSYLMFDIKNMLKENKLFNFMSCYKDGSKMNFEGKGFVISLL